MGQRKSHTVYYKIFDLINNKNTILSRHGDRAKDLQSEIYILNVHIRKREWFKINKLNCFSRSLKKNSKINPKKDKKGNNKNKSMK